MRYLRWLALLPFLGMLVTPFVLGLPLLMAWLVFCVIGTSAVMGIIYLADPANRAGGEGR